MLINFKVGSKRSIHEMEKLVVVYRAVCFTRAENVIFGCPFTCVVRVTLCNFRGYPVEDFIPDFTGTRE